MQTLYAITVSIEVLVEADNEDQASERALSLVATQIPKKEELYVTNVTPFQVTEVRYNNYNGPKTPRI